MSQIPLRFLQCKEKYHTPELDAFFFVEFVDGVIKIYCRQCGFLIYERNLKELRS